MRFPVPRPLTTALLLALLVGTARADTLESRFRGFLDRLKTQGQALAQGALPGVDEWRGKPVVRDRTDALPVGTGEFAVFTGPGCLSCQAAIDHLRSRKLRFTVLDIGRDDTARQSYALLGVKGLPVVLMPHEMLIGFERKAFEQAMKLDAQKAVREGNGGGA